jgi:hypothetical protein
VPNIASRTAYSSGNVSEESRFAFPLAAGRRVSSDPHEKLVPVLFVAVAAPSPSTRISAAWIISGCRQHQSVCYACGSTGNKHLKVLRLPGSLETRIVWLSARIIPCR